MVPLASGSSSSGGGSREILEGSRDPKGVPYVAKVTPTSSLLLFLLLIDNTVCVCILIDMVVVTPRSRHMLLR